MKKNNWSFPVLPATKMHFIFLCLLFANTVFSQLDSTRIKYLTLEDGLSQVSTNDLLLDKLGFVWIATQDGLNKFDGSTFKHYKYNENDSTTISGNLINKLLEDKNGNIWIGTIANGLNLYNPVKDVFKRIRLKNSGGNEIISDLEIDPDGAVWVASRISGLYRFTAKDDNLSQSHFLKNKPLGALLHDKSGDLWVGGFEGEVYRLNTKDEQSFLKIPEFKVNGNVQSIYRAGKYLLLGSDFGFYRYDIQAKKLELIELEETGNFKTKHVSSFLEEKETQVWIGTGNGVYLFDWLQKKVIKKIQYGTVNGLSNNTTEALLRLSKQKILIGTANYLNLIDFSQPYFSNISKDKLGEHLLNDNVIFSIFKDGTDLWVGTPDGGLNLIRDGKAYYLTQNNSKENGISGAVVRAIVKDEINKRMWLGTTRGLAMIDLTTFDPNNPEFLVFHSDPNNPNSINGDFLKDITLDKNNNIWGATFGHGIFRLEMSPDKKVKIFRYSNEINNVNSLKNDFTDCILADKDNTILVGTQGGLTKIQFADKKYSDPTFFNYYKSANSKKPLSHNSVYDILIDKQERIWVGTRYGLNLFLGDNEFESWTEQDQFPNAVVYIVQNDNDGNLWLGTNDGLIKFIPENESFSQYNVVDGIQSNEFDIHAKFKDKDGTLYMGGIGGITYFNPKNLKNIDTPKPLYLSQLRIKDQIMRPSNVSGILKNAVFHTNEIEFKQNQFPFYLEFSTIDYSFNNNMKYGYKLLPDNTEWNMLTDPKIQFLNLPSGSHTLQVNGFARGKEWNQAPLEIKLNIRPHWYKTWWAYLLYVGLFIALAFKLYRFQLSRKLALAESVRLKDLDHLKSNLYTNITHEFRTPLTVILGMASNLKANLRKKELDSAENSLEMIERNGSNLLRLVNELLDLAKLENEKMDINFIKGDIIPFIKYLSESFSTMADEAHIKLMVYAEIESLVMDYDVEKVSAIIYNLISNAIKFNNKASGKIIVHINRIIENNKEQLVLKVKDNGMGISKENIPHVFNRFYQVNTSKSRATEGTGIGLALTNEMVNLLQGSIEVKSEINKGSEFIVLLPITRNAAYAEDYHFEHKPEPVAFNPQRPREVAFPIDEDSTLPLSLIIEDNHDVAHYLETCLKGKYQTLHAVDGIQGIEMAKERVPDIIICDVMMPGKDGYEVCELLKTDERTDHIPIIILTAKVAMKDRLKGLSHGADAYLTKPFVKEELFTRLNQLISLRKKMLLKMEKDSFTSFLDKKAENPEAKFLKKVIKLIHGEIENSSFGSASLAIELSLSESQIYRKLKAITNKSTAVFIRSVRLQRAKELLQSSSKTVSEIAYETGFNDPSWFSRAFKEEFGVAPSEFIK
ncbi:ATP-binding protein [Cellulophaga sp. F20128]|uniref:hybrid sensor histidine kinase/response regulator transcription factor n=1 Tax=Cellulophaga sp. F20128 TaxID=2926413 RepID=UPI001FF1C50A|nr:hybrid sensor histidine kinase/response regulator transcription factor [Cellulophaga sp. F20128]MCK0157145.1 ATP-binding protein [Cellulophaga sp. F20128]